MLALPVDPESVLGAGAGVVEVVVGVVVPGSVLVGSVAVVVGPVVVDGSVLVVVVDGSELGGAALTGGVGAGVDIVVVAEVGSAPAPPAAATVGVVDCGSTVASVWVMVRPGGTLGFVLALVLPVVGSVCLAVVLSGDFLAVVEAFLAGAALCGCLTGAGWVRMETPPVSWGVVVVAAIGGAGADATTGLEVAV